MQTKFDVNQKVYVADNTGTLRQATVASIEIYEEFTTYLIQIRDDKTKYRRDSEVFGSPQEYCRKILKDFGIDADIVTKKDRGDIL